jgi:hypothetical protein
MREWGFFVGLILIAKLLTMVFSIFAGYFYFMDIFTGALNNLVLSKIFSILCLIIIELSTAISVTKLFKFIFKKKISLVLLSLLIASVTFSISFISSTNGLALRQSKKVDKTGQIERDYIQLVQDTKQVYKQKIDEVDKLIELEKGNPQGWKGKDRNTLLTDQLERINGYRLTINNLNDQLAARLDQLQSNKIRELENNKVVITLEADKFYNLVAGIMVLIFTINGLLVFFYSRIAKGNPLTELEIEAKEQADKLIRRAFGERFKFYTENDPGTKAEEIRHCKQCGAGFTPKHWNQRYCSENCKTIYNEKRNN